MAILFDLKYGLIGLYKYKFSKVFFFFFYTFWNCQSLLEIQVIKTYFFSLKIPYLDFFFLNSNEKLTSLPVKTFVE